MLMASRVVLTGSFMVAVSRRWRLSLDLWASSDKRRDTVWSQPATDGFSAECLRLACQDEEGGLGDILCVVMVGQDPHRDRVDHRSMALKRLTEQGCHIRNRNYLSATL
jgi:hypothetical protein